MTDRNTISQVIESLFEDWIDKNINVHPLAVENMRILEADALAMLKEHDNCENCAIAIEDRQPIVRCKDCKFFNDYFVECEKNNHTHGAAWFCADGIAKDTDVLNK